MHNIIPPLLIIIGISGLIILLNEKQFKRQNLEEEEGVVKKNEFSQSILFKKWHSIFNKKNFELLNTRLSNFFAKLLIRLRIIILRIDQVLLKALDKLKKRTTNKTEPSKFSLLAEKNISLLIEESHLNTTLDFKKEERKFLIAYFENSQDKTLLINLAHLYLYKNDFSSARWALLEAYRLAPDDQVIQDLLLELKEKEESN